jgi:molybdopterin-containing oxidoreductase family membrane subunit
MAKVMLAMGLIVAYGYLMENFMAFYSGDVNERFNAIDRLVGHYAPLYWGLLFANVVVPQLLWFRRFRTNPAILWVISIIINIGMWLERFIIIVQSLTKDFLPSAWHLYSPTIWDILTLLGTIGLFLTLMFLFVRLLPSIPMFEMRELIHKLTHGSGESKQEPPAIVDEAGAD